MCTASNLRAYKYYTLCQAHRSTDMSNNKRDERVGIAPPTDVSDHQREEGKSAKSDERKMNLRNVSLGFGIE